DFIPDLSSVSSLPNLIIVGDFNAHHNVWLSTQTIDTRGIGMLDQVESLPLVILNDDRPTRVTGSARPTSPDLSIASTSVSSRMCWNPMPALSSDHLPILLEVSLSRPIQNSI